MKPPTLSPPALLDRRSRRVAGLIFAAVMVAAPVGVLSSGYQSSSPFEPQFPTIPGADRSNRNADVGMRIPDAESRVSINKRLRALNSARHKELLSDADKLVKLAQELNQEISTADTPSATPEQLRKIGEIGKLAKNVKEKMTYSIGTLPAPEMDHP